MKRACSSRKENGEPCGAPAVGGNKYCFWHSPEHAQEAAEARHLGGLRRRREVTLAGAYDFEGLDTVEHIRRVAEIAVMDTLGLENSIARARTLLYAAQVAGKLLESGEMEERIEALERAIQAQREEDSVPSFDPDPTDTDQEELT